MSLLPARLNDHLLALSLLAGAYAGFRWYKGGGYAWKFIVGFCAYMIVSGLWQIWVTRNK